MRIAVIGIASGLAAFGVDSKRAGVIIASVSRLADVPA